MAKRQLNTNISNFHVQYLDVTSQHWNPQSASFAGGDHLMTAIAHGWDIVRCVETQHWYAGMRSVTVYRFELERDNEKMNMPVLTNPAVARFVHQMDLDIVKEDAQSKTA